MAASTAKTVEEYIKSLTPEKQEIVSFVRSKLLENMPENIVENMNWGMISYEIPLNYYPKTYNNKPLMYAALAAQKNYYSIYLTNCYINEDNMNKLLEAFDKIGVKPNMGKSCIRFTRLNKIPLDTIAEIVSSTTVDGFINEYEKIKIL